MGTPGLGYSLYLFLGKRGKAKPKNGYGVCLFDSRNPECNKAVKDPKLKIDENCSGTVEFTVLTGETATVMHSSDGGTTIDETEGQINKFVKYMQSEIVAYRTELKTNNQIEETELWAGRVYSIKKDFYNNWSVVAEGSLGYLNDFTLAAKKWSKEASSSADTLLSSLIDSYNALVRTYSIDSHSTVTVDIGLPSPVTVATLDRRIYKGKVDTEHLIDTARTLVSSGNEDNVYEVSNGTNYYEAFQQLLERFGGYFEFRYEFDASGYSKTYIDWYGSDQYHQAKVSEQAIFGVNLLDYQESMEDSEFFTALMPIGTATSEVVDAEGNKTSQQVDVFITDVNAQHPGTPYIYDDALVDKYGFIERRESWSIDTNQTLYRVAMAYYKDLKLSEPEITIDAFDLKNLLTTDLAKDEYKQLTSLYLYDKIKIRSGNKKDSGYITTEIPIVGIEIPFSKFPTDTKYTMTRKRKKKTALSPGKIIQRTKIPSSNPNPTPGGGEDPKPTPEDDEKYVDPVGGKYGVDLELPHYPPIYNDQPYIYPSVNGMASVTKDGKTSYCVNRLQWGGCAVGRVHQESPGAVFYNGGKGMQYLTRERKDGEFVTDYYAGDYYQEPAESDRMPNSDKLYSNFINGNTPYFSNDEANIVPSQPWAKMTNMLARPLDIAQLVWNHVLDGAYGSRFINVTKNDLESDLTAYGFRNSVASAITSIASAALSDTGTRLINDPDDTLYLSMTVDKSSSGGNTYTVRCPLINIPKTSNFGAIGTLTINGVTIIYFASLKNSDQASDFSYSLLVKLGQAIVRGRTIKELMLYEDPAGSHPTFSAAEIKDQLQLALKSYLLLHLVPIMIITPTKDIATGADHYGIMVCSGTPNLSKIENNTYKLTGGGLNSSSNPVMFTADMLTSNYAFYEDSSHTNLMSKITPIGYQTKGPITILSRCGGQYTHHISINTYSQLAGSRGLNAIGYQDATTGDPAKSSGMMLDVAYSPKFCSGVLASKTYRSDLGVDQYNYKKTTIVKKYPNGHPIDFELAFANDFSGCFASGESKFDVLDFLGTGYIPNNFEIVAVGSAVFLRLGSSGIYIRYNV